MTYAVHSVGTLSIAKPEHPWPCLPCCRTARPRHFPFLLRRNMQLGNLTDSHLRRPNARLGCELVKPARACSRLMQNAPARWYRVNSEEAVRRCDDALAQRPRRTGSGNHPVFEL